MDERIFILASKTLRVSIDDAHKNYKYIPEIDAYYFWNPTRGGLSVVINVAGEKLVAGSAVNPSKLVSEFKSGRRN